MLYLFSGLCLPSLTFPDRMPLKICSKLKTNICFFTRPNVKNSIWHHWLIILFLEKTAYMLVCTIYILIGMSFFTTIIELVRFQYLSDFHISSIFAYKKVSQNEQNNPHRRQYAESWRRMQELRAQIQATERWMVGWMIIYPF